MKEIRKKGVDTSRTNTVGGGTLRQGSTHSRKTTKQSQLDTLGKVSDNTHKRNNT